MTTAPYLSFVVTARNDNHGGDMLRRMQIFVNGLLEQCRRHQLSAELIIVEWNPPQDRPKLTEALNWTLAQDSPCTVRVIEVPPEVHLRLKHGTSLPLFQMIAKNVGIRRARGEFILATNIDVLFSDELCRFLAKRELRRDVSYRIDRHDVSLKIPADVSLEEQLEFCQDNVVLIFARNGIIELHHESSTELPPLVAEAVPPAEAAPIVEPAPTISPELPPEELLPPLPAPEPKSWVKRAKVIYQFVLPLPLREAILNVLPLSMRDTMIRRGLLKVKESPAQLLPSEPIVLPELPISTTPDPAPAEITASEAAAPEATEAPVYDPGYPLLHTYACGDFHLLSKELWFKVRGYAELPIFSFHLDSLFLHTAYHAGGKEVILEEPMRLYHIEHKAGWTPEIERSQTLNDRLKKLEIPQLSMEQFTAFATLMQQMGEPIIMNSEDWGMVNDQLPEYWIGQAANVSNSQD
ncbi:MAG TPA: hypothetical protein V6C64_06990 [Microcoleaceae cyanobacterium]|jgi:hypothetical protein